MCAALIAHWASQEVIEEAIVSRSACPGGSQGVGTKADARDGFTQAGGKPFGAGGRGDPSGGTAQSPGAAFPPQRDRRALRR